LILALLIALAGNVTQFFYVFFNHSFIYEIRSTPLLLWRRCSVRPAPSLLLPPPLQSTRSLLANVCLAAASFLAASSARLSKSVPLSGPNSLWASKKQNDLQ
jgi:hypothetical protein